MLKNISGIFKLMFENDFIKSFKDQVCPPRDYQKEIAENTAKIVEEIKKTNSKSK